MKRIDTEFEAELDRELSSSGPLRRKGFTDELRRRIEERVDEKEKKSIGQLLARTGKIAAATLALASVALFAAFHDNGTKVADQALYNVATADTSTGIEAFSSTAEPRPSFTSGLLLGLRTDDKEPSYRTLYIAPRKERPVVVAQGSGILVPYKRDFYRIEPLHYETQTDRYDFFVAHPAEQRPVEARKIAPAMFKDDPKQQVLHSEKVVFAANEYVSIVESNETLDLSGNRTDLDVRAWTSTIPALTAKRDRVTLNDVLKQSSLGYEYTTDEWIVARNQGRWAAMAAYPGPSAETYTSSFRLVNVQLPKSVINHDEPCCTWNELGTRFPGATDAYSSPDKDMTVVSTDGLLLVYGSPDQLSGEPALSVKLKPKETVVMAQWATDHYVEEWAAKTSKLLR